MYNLSSDSGPTYRHDHYLCHLFCHIRVHDALTHLWPIGHSRASAVWWYYHVTVQPSTPSASTMRSEFAWIKNKNQIDMSSNKQAPEVILYQHAAHMSTQWTNQFGTRMKVKLKWLVLWHCCCCCWCQTCLLWHSISQAKNGNIQKANNLFANMLWKILIYWNSEAGIGPIEEKKQETEGWKKTLWNTTKHSMWAGVY